MRIFKKNNAINQYKIHQKMKLNYVEINTINIYKIYQKMILNYKINYKEMRIIQQ